MIELSIILFLFLNKIYYFYFMEINTPKKIVTLTGSSSQAVTQHTETPSPLKDLLFKYSQKTLSQEKVKKLRTITPTSKKIKDISLF